MSNTQYGLICLGLAIASVVACAVAFANPPEDNREYPHTIEQISIMMNTWDETGTAESVGPSATYWSQRNMPLYIQNGCTENVFKEKQACPF